jgi:hypothetical protein
MVWWCFYDDDVFSAVVMFLVFCCWWCGCVVLGRLCSWPSNFALCDVFILAFVTWGLDTLVHAFGE